MSESPHARVSENERERALQELSRHFSVGRLTALEFDERSIRVWEAGTRRQLAEMFADLPPSPPLAAGAEGGGPIPGLVLRIGAIAILTMVFWLALGDVEWVLVLGAITVLLLIRTRPR